MRRLSVGIIGVLICAWMAIASAQNPGGSDAGKKMKNPVAASPESIAKGKELFTKNCRFCHGADAKGNGPMAPEGTHPSDLTDAKWDRGATDGESVLVSREGAGQKMHTTGETST